MALFSIPNVAIKGLAASAPKNVEHNMDCAIVAEKDRKKLILTTGIEKRRIVKGNTTSADLCRISAEKLLHELNWEKDSIDVLVFVTQTPDYLIPCTSTILQEKLSLSKNTLCIDINLGCSGYVYGLSTIASYLSFMPGKKGLLLVGDTSSKCISQQDKSVAPLFSDAGSATALVHQEGEKISFNLQSDGAGFQAIWIPDGGYRNQYTPDSSKMQEIDTDINRTNLDLILNGIDVFNFSMREVAPNIKNLMEWLNISNDDADYFLFHQANKLLNDSIRKKLQLEREKMPLSLKEFGNTSSASIPVTMVTEIREQLSSESTNLILSGFGVGLSWGSAYLKTDKIVCPPMIEVEE